MRSSSSAAKKAWATRRKTGTKPRRQKSKHKKGPTSKQHRKFSKKRLTLKDLSGLRLKRRLSIQRARQSYHNHHVDGSGNFGIVLIKGPWNWHRIDGRYNSKGEITYLQSGPYAEAGATLQVKTFDDLISKLEKRLK